MLLKQMEYFCAVVERGSFTKAATACFVSQSAISQQIKLLEADLDCTLLARNGRSFILTPAGESFYRHARDILNRTSAARREAQRLGRGEPERLALGYHSRYDGPEIACAIAEFARRHPNTAIAAVSGTHNELYAKLLDGTIDLKVNDRRRQLSDEFVNERLFTAHLAVELSPHHSLAEQQNITVSDLAGQTCLLLAHNDAQAAIERSYHQDVLNFPCDFLFAHTLEEARMLVAANRGMFIVDVRERPPRRLDASSSVNPSSNDAPIDTAMPIVRRPLHANNAPLTCDYYVFWQKEHDTAANHEFTAILKEHFAQQG